MFIFMTNASSKFKVSISVSCVLSFLSFNLHIDRSSYYVLYYVIFMAATATGVLSKLKITILLFKYRNEINEYVMNLVVFVLIHLTKKSTN